MIATLVLSDYRIPLAVVYDATSHHGIGSLSFDPVASTEPVAWATCPCRPRYVVGAGDPMPRLALDDLLRPLCYKAHRSTGMLDGHALRLLRTIGESRIETDDPAAVCRMLGVPEGEPGVEIAS